MIEYWKIVCNRAWRDTIAFYPILESPREAWFRILGHVVAGIIFTMGASQSEIMGEINVWWTFVVATTTTFILLLIANGVCAPHRIYNGQRSKINILRGRLGNREKGRAAAAPLREQLQLIDLICGEKVSIFNSQRILTSILEWDSDVLEIMRDNEVPESEIHMYETISHIPNDSHMLFSHESNKFTRAVEVKREKLRLIINRLLEEPNSNSASD